MARKLKVFSADMGFFRAIIAASSQKAALEAWGVRDDLFARGAAREVDDAELVKEAIASPGEVIRKPIGDATAIVGGAKPPKGVTGANASNRPAAAATKPPSRKALSEAEEALRMAESSARAALEEVQTEQEQLDARRQRVKAEGAETVKAAKSKLRDAKAAFERAFPGVSLGR